MNPSTSDLISPLNLATWATGGKYQAARHLRVLQDAVLETLYSPDIDILVAMAPPRHGKSEFLSRWVATWFHSVFPTKASILASYSVDLAREHSRFVREHVNWLAPVYGHGGVNPFVSSASDWQLMDGGKMLAAGVGGGITGRPADLFIIDDVLKNAEEAISGRIRESQWEWFQTTALTRLEPGGKFLVLGTRWYEDDLLGRLCSLSNELGIRVKSVRLPALAEPTPDEPDLLGRKTGEPLWPERWDLAYLLRWKNTLEPYWWNAMFQQRLGTYGKNEWPSEYFWGIMANDDEWPEKFAISATALDPSKGRHQRKGDYSAIVFAGFRDGTIWVDADLERRPVPKMMRDLVEFNRVHRPTVCGIEATAFQELLAPDYQLAQQEMGSYRDDPVLVENTVNKDLRIGRLGLWLRKHKIKIRRNKGGELLLKQLKEFPNGQHEDGADALEVAIRLLCQIADDLQDVGADNLGSLTIST